MLPLVGILFPLLWKNALQVKICVSTNGKYLSNTGKNSCYRKNYDFHSRKICFHYWENSFFRYINVFRQVRIIFPQLLQDVLNAFFTWIFHSLCKSRLPVSPRWNLLWRGEEAHLTKKFHPVCQQGEFAGATQLHSSRTNGPSLC